MMTHPAGVFGKHLFCPHWGLAVQISPTFRLIDSDSTFSTLTPPWLHLSWLGSLYLDSAYSTLTPFTLPWLHPLYPDSSHSTLTPPIVTPPTLPWLHLLYIEHLYVWKTVKFLCELHVIVVAKPDVAKKLVEHPTDIRDPMLTNTCTEFHGNISPLIVKGGKRFYQKQSKLIETHCDVLIGSLLPPLVLLAVLIESLSSDFCGERLLTDSAGSLSLDMRGEPSLLYRLRHCLHH